MSKFTPHQLSEARRLRENGNGMGKPLSWKKVGKLVGANGFSLRVALDPICAELRRQEMKISAVLRTLDLHGSPKMVIPRDVLFDRDRRMELAPRTLTARIFGDPLPGCSALDRKGA